MVSEKDDKPDNVGNGSSAYYDKGSQELAEDTPLTLRRLETVRQLKKKLSVDALMVEQGFVANSSYSHRPNSRSPIFLFYTFSNCRDEN